MRLYLREQLRGSGFSELDEQISENIEGALDLSEKQRLIEYLYLVRDTLRLSSTDSVDRVVNAFGGLQSSKQSGGVTGLEVELSSQDAAVYGIRSLDLYNVAIDPRDVELVDELISILIEDEEA